MSAPPYMKLFWGDYHKATRHLRRDQHGAYFLLIGEAWRLGGALPDDDARLAAWALCTTEEWSDIKPIVMDFFTLRRGKWWHDRVREELASYEATSRKRKEAGKKGGKASYGKDTGNAEANASLLPTKPEQEPEPKDRKEAIASPVGSAEPMPTPDPWSKDIDFAKAWDACTEAGRKRSSRKKAWPEWRAALKRETGPVLATAMARYVAADEDAKRTGGPGFHSWLKDGRYEHWTAPTSAGASTPTIFDGPPDLRAAVVRERDEDFARRWLDHYCRWRAGDRTLLAANDTVAAALKRDLAGWLTKAQVRVEVAAANTNAPLLDLGAAA